MLNKTVWGWVFLGLGCLVSCENKDEANLFKAKSCINKATADTVETCLNHINGQSSKSSYVVRCSAAFIAEGVDDDAIIEAMRNIKGDKAGNPTTPAIAALAMSDTEASTHALSMCTLSGSESLIALANFANLSTAMTGLLPVTPPYKADEIEDAIDNYTNGGTQEEKEALGNAVLVGQDSLCNKKTGLFKGTDACKSIDSSVAAHPNDAGAVAEALIAALKN